MATSTYNELISLAEQIRTATAADSNTAELLGGTLKQLIQFVGTLSSDTAIAEGLAEIEAALEEAQSSVSSMETDIQTAVSEAQTAINTAKAAAIEEISEFGGVEVVQETGESTTAVMSQKATSRILDARYKKYYNFWIYGADIRAHNVGENINLVVSTNSTFPKTYVWSQIDVKEGETYYIDRIYFGYSSNRNAYIICDADGIILAKSTGKDNTNLSLTMPAGAAKMYLCHDYVTVPTIPTIYKCYGIDDEVLDFSENLPYGERDGGNFWRTIPDVGSSFSTASSSGVFVGYIMPVTAGDRLRLTFNSQAAAKRFAFIDNNNVCIYVDSGDNAFLNGYEIDVPDGAAFFVANVSVVTGASGKTDYKFEVIRHNDDVVRDHIHKESAVYAMSKTHNTGMVEDEPTPRLTFAWCSDTHGDAVQYKRIVDYANHYIGAVDGVLHTGDMCRFSMTDKGFGDTIEAYQPNIPFISVLGNHDAFGYSLTISSVSRQRLTSGTRQYNGEQLLKPYVASGALWGTDYDEDGNDGYYYKDFTTHKIRMIMLNNYDCPRWCAGTNWQTTTDATEIESAVAWTSGTSYAVGDIVFYKGLYLKCLVAGTLDDNGTLYANNQGRYCFSKYNINTNYYDQKQVDFLINALSTLASGWSAVICQHTVIESQTTSHTKGDDAWQADNAISSGVMTVTHGQNGYVIQDIVSAYLNRTTLSKTYEAIQPVSNPLGNVTKINNTTELPNVTVSADFTSAMGDVICCMAGHTHADANFFSKQTGDLNLLQLCMTSSCYMPARSATKYNYMGDLIKGGTAGRDCFNIVSFDTVNKYVYLLRIGADMTANFTERKFTRINYAHS